ncbi:hypothetical protein FB451DRAFT_1172637 [Mycena latifolia]|nr:hypothetical protein FB451DRAFT_1172637 [Mycena latifolia]
MSSARLAGSEGNEGKGDSQYDSLGVITYGSEGSLDRKLRSSQPASSTGDNEGIKQKESGTDDEGPDYSESEHEQRRRFKTTAYGSGGKIIKEKSPVEVQIEGRGTRAIALSAAWIPAMRRWSGTENRRLCAKAKPISDQSE